MNRFRTSDFRAKEGRRFAALLVAALAGFAPLAAEAEVFRPNTTADLLDGTTATLSLREAVVLANSNADPDDTILLEGGAIYTLTLVGANENAAATGDLDVADDAATAGTDTIRIRSQGPRPAVVDGNATDRVFHIGGAGAAALELHETVVRNGLAAGGGGILATGAGTSLLVDRCVVESNVSAAGALAGGGLRVVVGAQATLRRSLFTGNGTAGSANTGAIFANDTATVLTIENCTISGNSSNNLTGGIFVQGGTFTMRNSTVTGNTAVASIGGIGRSGGTANIFNSIVAGNVAGTVNPDVSGDFVSNGANLIGDKTGSASFATDLGPMAANLAIDVAAADNGGPTLTHALVAMGPAEDAGVDGDAPASGAYDQRGAPRFVGTVDIGAVESGSIVVDTLADENDGVGVGTGTSLREAIAVAPNGGGVVFADALFAAGPYPKEILLTLGELTLANPATVAGPGANALAVDGNDTTRVFHFTATSGEISGLTIRDGLGTTDGAGVANTGTGELTLNDCALLDNTTTMNGSAAIRNQSSGTILANRCLISGNMGTGNGGAVRNASGTMALTDCTLTGNATTSGTGGGAVSNSGGTLTMTGCTMTGNDAVGPGGGIRNISGTVTVRNSVVAGNTSSGSTSVDVSGAFASNGTNVIGDKTGSASFAADFGPVAASAVIETVLADNGGPMPTFAIVAGGPADDAGTNADVPAGSTTDARGAAFPRIVGAAVDIGAFEGNGAVNVPVEVSGFEID